MIYVSSSCVRAEKIADSVDQLAKAGFTNIELSGGTKFYSSIEDDLFELKEKYNLNYLCHNYFPPPEKDFVLNIASLNDEISESSVQHIIKAISLSQKIGGIKYAFHAGFLINIETDEVGKPIPGKDLYDRTEARDRFCNNFLRIMKNAGSIDIYIENNVISSRNFDNFNRINPLFITDSSGVEEFKSRIDFKLLLDIAHLKVSCKTLNLNFNEEITRLVSGTDYIHISDNDGFSDSNNPVKSGSELYSLLKQLNFNGKTVTLEVYSSLDNVRNSYDIIEQLFI